MKLRIKDTYKDKIIVTSKTKIVVADIPDSKYKYYYENGLAYIFEKVETKSKKVRRKKTCPTCKNGECICNTCSTCKNKECTCEDTESRGE